MPRKMFYIESFQYALFIKLGLQPFFFKITWKSKDLQYSKWNYELFSYNKTTIFEMRLRLILVQVSITYDM